VGAGAAPDDVPAAGLEATVAGVECTVRFHEDEGGLERVLELAGVAMSKEATTKALQALWEMAVDAHADEEFACALFDFCTGFVFFQMSDATKKHVDECVRMIRDTLDGVKVKMIREDKLN
jgi:hypothetical protein